MMLDKAVVWCNLTRYASNINLISIWRICSTKSWLLFWGGKRTNFYLKSIWCILDPSYMYIARWPWLYLRPISWVLESSHVRTCMDQNNAMNKEWSLCIFYSKPILNSHNYGSSAQEPNKQTPSSSSSSSPVTIRSLLMVRYSMNSFCRSTRGDTSYSSLAAPKRASSSLKTNPSTSLL